MATLAEKVRKALYGKLNVAGVTTYVSTRIYNMTAPETAVYPFLTYTRQAPGAVVYGLDGSVQLEDDLWMIKALTTEDDSASYAPQELADLILEAALTAIGTTLTLSGGTTRIVRRFSDIPPMADTVSDRLVYQHGFLLRVAAQ